MQVSMMHSVLVLARACGCASSLLRTTSSLVRRIGLAETEHGLDAIPDRLISLAL